MLVNVVLFEEKRNQIVIQYLGLINECQLKVNKPNKFERNRKGGTGETLTQNR